MRLEKIVVGMDFSHPSVALAQWVTTTLAPDAEIVMVHALDRPHLPSFLGAQTPPGDPMEIAARIEAVDRMRDVELIVHAPRLRTEVRAGRPHEVVCALADEIGADLIAVGAHGEGSHESLLLGTTADRIVRIAHAPVLVGARTAMTRGGRVVVGVEDAPITQRVMLIGDLIARQLDARMTVLHVLSPATYSRVAALAAANAREQAPGGAIDFDVVVSGELQRQAKDWLRECAAAGADAKRVDPETSHGAVAEEILATAKLEGASVIVVGRHGREGSSPLLGRTVRHLLHGAECALVVVPPAWDDLEE